MNATITIPTLSLPTMPRILLGKDAAILRAFDAYVTRHGADGVVVLPSRFVARLLVSLEEWGASTCDAHTFYRTARIIRASIDGYTTACTIGFTLRFDAATRTWTNGDLGWTSFDGMVDADDQYRIECLEDEEADEYSIDLLKMSLGINPFN
jgi:hypothetical protein